MPRSVSPIGASSVYPSLFLGALIVGVLSWPLSLLMLRLKGGEFAIGMWVVSELAHLLVNLDTLVRGETGTSLIELNAYASESRRALTYWCALGAMAGLLAIVFRLLRSPLGAAIQAIRDNEEAAESVGVRVMSAKRLVFTLAAFGAALAGALWVATALTFQPKAYFSPLWTAYMIFMALVGGLGTFEGAILGAVIFFAIETWFGDMGVWYLVGLGATALIFALLFPRGIWGWVEDRTSLQAPAGRLPSAASRARKERATRTTASERTEEGRLTCFWERRSSSPEFRPASARASVNSPRRSAPTSSASTSMSPSGRSTPSSRRISARLKA